MPIQARRSSANVFHDLRFGDEEAENLRIRADLMIELRRSSRTGSSPKRLPPNSSM